MASLAILLAAAPFRAVVHLSDGRRMRVRGLEEAPADGELAPYVFVDTHGAEVGRRALQARAAATGGVIWRASPAETGGTQLTDDLGVVWSGVSLFALILRRMLLAGERTAGEPVTHVTLITPSGLDAADSRALEASAHLAGAAEVVIEDVGKLIVEAPNTDIGERHLLVQFDRDQMRVSLFRSGAAGAVLEVNADLSEEWSGSSIGSRMVRQLGVDEDPRVGEDFLMRRLPEWSGMPAFELTPAAFEAPAPLFLSSDVVSDLADKVVEQVRAVITLRSVDVNSLNWVHLQGRWATGLRSRFAALFRRSRIVAADSPGAVLELARLSIQPRRTLETTLVADHPPNLRIPNPTPVSRTLLTPGAALPATFIEDSFPTQSFYDSVGLFSRGADGIATPLGEIALPRLFEKRPFGLLKVRVTADTEHFLMLHAELAISENGLTLLYDKQAGTARIIPTAVVRTLQRQDLPTARIRTTAPA